MPAPEVVRGSSEAPASKARGTNSLKRGKLPPQLIRFQVELEEPNRIYFAGDEIKGRVRVDLTDSLPIQGIILRIVGEAYVNVSDEPRPWTGRRMGKISSTFRNRKISPSSASEKMDVSVAGGNGPFFFGSNPSGNWESGASSLSRSPRSTLQRDQKCPAKKSVGRRGEDSNRKFRSHEKYFEHKAYVFGHKYSSSREMMWTGQHSFPFTYCLPSKLPTSFHGRFGYVRYFCEASLERHNLPTVQRRAFFSVNNVMDLNTDSKADSGVSKDKKTNSWCFCCASGTIIVSAKVRRRGFVPGETIPIQAHVLNVSNKMISKISAKIVQIATYYSSRAFRNHSDETVVCEKSEGKIPPGESRTWEETGPRVPPIPPSSTMIDCKLITLGYRLDFVLDIAGMKEPLVLKIPLRIGTIPLEKSFKRMSESSDKDDVWSSSITTLPLQILLKYPKIPEAYSLKCVKGDRNVDRYYFRQIPRAANSMTGINLRMPNAPVQPVLTDDSETYAPRYIAYRELEDDPEKCEKEISNGRIAEENCNTHLVIRVSPPSRNQGPIPGSTTYLVNETASVYSDSPAGSPVDARKEEGNSLTRRVRTFSAPSRSSLTYPEESKKSK